MEDGHPDQEMSLLLFKPCLIDINNISGSLVVCFSPIQSYKLNSN